MKNHNLTKQDVPTEPEFTSNYVRPVRSTKLSVRDNLLWNAPSTFVVTIFPFVAARFAKLSLSSIIATIAVVTLVLAGKNFLSLRNGLKNIDESNQGIWPTVLLMLYQILLLAVVLFFMINGFF
jgi:hypothetical protein